MAKSPNKHNRLYAQAASLGDKLPGEIENNKVTPRDDPKVRAKILSDEFEWDKNDALKLWCFGPENNGANLLVDTTKGV